MFSASFRQGITTETSGVWRCVRAALPACWSARLCSWRAPGERVQGAGARATRPLITSRRSGKWRSSSVGARARWDASGMRICLVYDCLFPLHRRRAPSAGIATSPSAWRPTGHEVTYLTLRQWARGERAAARAARARASRSGPRMALYTAGGRRRIAAAARLRAGRAAAPAAPRPPLRRRAHRLVPVLLAARRRRCCGRSARLRAGRRLARGVEPRVLARVPRRASAGAIGYAVQRACARLRQQRLLLLAPARRAAARGGAARRGDGPRGRVRRLAGARPYRGRPSRWSCSPGA